MEKDFGKPTMLNSFMTLKTKARSKRLSGTSMLTILFTLFTLLLGVTAISTYASFQSQATSSGTLDFSTPIYDITLDNANATTNGTSTIYEKYVIGIFQNSTCTTEITTNQNNITVPARAYTVGFNSNGGSACANQTATYTFKGYYTATTGGTQLLNASGYITNNFTPTYFDSNSTLNAQWTSASITLPTPTYTGYTFNGWYNESGLTNKVGDGGDNYTPTESKMLYAKWTINSYTVTVNVDGTNSYGSVNTTSFSVNHGTKIYANSNTLRQGTSTGTTKSTATATTNNAQYTYAFSKWASGGSDIASGGYITITGATTITAHFSRTVNNYTVTINTSGSGSVNNSSITNVPYGSTIKVGTSANILNVNGTNITATASAATAQYTYSFSKWTRTTADGTQINTTGFTITGATIVYAVFTSVVNNYTVSIVSNNTGYGTVNVASVANVPYGTAITTSGNTVNINGTTVTATAATQTAQYTYSFSSWTNGTATVQGALTVTANFSRSTRSYTITVSAGTYIASVYGTTTQGAASGSTSVTANYGAKVYLYSTLGSATGYTYSFNTWTRSSGTGTITNPTTQNGAYITIAGTATVTASANRSANQYSITYKDGGNTNFSGTHESGYPTTHTYGTATTLKSASKTGYTFGGWFTASGCTGSAVTSLGATAYTSGITLYAKWRPIECNVNINLNGGSSITLTFSGNYSRTYTGTPWMQIVYNDNELWREDENTIIGISGTRSGFTFNGLYTASSGGSKVVNTNGSLVAGVSGFTNSSGGWAVANTNVTLYAQWTVVTHYIHLVFDCTSQYFSSTYYVQTYDFLYSIDTEYTNTSTIKNSGSDFLGDLVASELIWSPNHTYDFELCLSYPIAHGSTVYIYTAEIYEDECVEGGVISASVNQGATITYLTTSSPTVGTTYSSYNSYAGLTYKIWEVQNITTDLIVTFTLSYIDDA